MISSSKLTVESESEASEVLERSEGSEGSDSEWSYVYSDTYTRCWPQLRLHHRTVLFTVLSLGRSLQMSTSVLFADTVLTADTVLYTNFYGIIAPHCPPTGNKVSTYASGTRDAEFTLNSRSIPSYTAALMHFLSSIISLLRVIYPHI